MQCDAGDVNRNLIPCARHLLVEQRTTAEEDFKENVGHDLSSFVHVVMIIQLPRLVGGCEAFAGCLLYTSPSPRDGLLSRMPSSA